MIEKHGKQWVLWDAKGTRILGIHETRQKAERQELAVRLSKLRKQGRIPAR